MEVIQNPDEIRMGAPVVRLVKADDVKDIICKYENRSVVKTMIFAVENLPAYIIAGEEAMRFLGQTDIKFDD